MLLSSFSEHWSLFLLSSWKRCCWLEKVWLNVPDISVYLAFGHPGGPSSCTFSLNGCPRLHPLKTLVADWAILSVWMAVCVYTPSLSTSTQNRQNYYGPLNDEVAWASRAETKPGMNVPADKSKIRLLDILGWASRKLYKHMSLQCISMFYMDIY